MDDKEYISFCRQRIDEIDVELQKQKSHKKSSRWQKLYKSRVAQEIRMKNRIAGQSRKTKK